MIIIIAFHKRYAIACSYSMHFCHVSILSETERSGWEYFRGLCVAKCRNEFCLPIIFRFPRVQRRRLPKRNPVTHQQRHKFHPLFSRKTKEISLFRLMLERFRKPHHLATGIRRSRHLSSRKPRKSVAPVIRRTCGVRILREVQKVATLV